MGFPVQIVLEFTSVMRILNKCYLFCAKIFKLASLAKMLIAVTYCCASAMGTCFTCGSRSCGSALSAELSVKAFMIFRHFGCPGSEESRD